MGHKCLECLTGGTAVCSLSPTLEKFVKQAFCEADPGIPVVLHGGGGWLLCPPVSWPGKRRHWLLQVTSELDHLLPALEKSG